MTGPLDYELDRHFYEVIVDEGEARIVESEIKHKILHKNIEKRELEAIKKKCTRKIIISLLAIYRGIDSE